MDRTESTTTSDCSLQLPNSHILHNIIIIKRHNYFHLASQREISPAIKLNRITATTLLSIKSTEAD